MSQYKYYFKKPKEEIAADIFRWLAVGTVITAVVTAPNAVGQIIRFFPRRLLYPRKTLYNAFYYLYKSGCLEISYRNHQIYIALTEDGRRIAGRFQINHLKIKKPKRWDYKWRIVIFDIADKHRIKREALRGFLKRLQLYPLQKSVWICPYDCRDEIKLLQNFFALSNDELRLIVSSDIGDDTKLRSYFKI